MPRLTRAASSRAACSVEGALSLIEGKWKIIILYKLLKQTLRFNEIRRQIPDVTQRMPTRQLREPEADGLLIRTVYAQAPPRVEYSLSSPGAQPGARDRGPGNMGRHESALVPGRSSVNRLCIAAAPCSRVQKKRLLLRGLPVCGNAPTAIKE